jgi:uncharacterized protein (DUF486 family)
MCAAHRSIQDEPIITRSGFVVFAIFYPGEKLELHPRLAVLIRD